MASHVFFPHFFHHALAFVETFIGLLTIIHAFFFPEVAQLKHVFGQEVRLRRVRVVLPAQGHHGGQRRSGEIGPNIAGKTRAKAI